MPCILSTVNEGYAPPSAAETRTAVSDAALMAQLVDGDDLALNVLMARWQDRVASFLFQMTGSREIALDLAQETFVRLYQARARYRHNASFSTYLFGIAANLARNHARWKKRHPCVSLSHDNDSQSHLAELKDPGQTPEHAEQSREQLLSIHKALQELPRDLREAMALFIYEDLGYAAIATITGCSPKAVETRIYRARQLLKTKLRHLFS
jgi:RNA polymerase sigma-70 factor (ECF subfamily)